MRTAVSIFFLVGCTDRMSYDVCVPPLTHTPSTFYEGQWTPLEVTLPDSAPCGASIRFYFFKASGELETKLRADPESVAVSDARPTATVSILALNDADALDETATMELYISGTIAGESPQFTVTVIDKDAP